MSISTIDANSTAIPSPTARRRILLVAMVFALGSGVAKSETLNLSQAAPGVYVHQGRHLGLSSPERDDIANIGFIAGDRCVAVIDTGGSIEIGHRLRTAVRSLTSKPVCYVINTHVHYDHILGNAAFLGEGAKFVGHKNLVAAVENNRTFFLQSFARELGTEAGPERIKGPDVTVAKTKILDLGNRKLELTAHRTAHTDSDLSVFDMKTKTLWIADLLFVERVPAIDGSIKGWIEESEALFSREFSKVIPGHGRIPGDWRAALQAQIRYFKTLTSEIRSILQKGGFLEDALGSVGRSEKDRWLLFEEHHPRNVARAFAELEWE